MFVRSTYWMWTSGKFTVTLTAGLDPKRSYLMTGALTGKSGGDYGQVYISTVCTQRSSDQVLCGIRGAPSDPEKQKIRNLGAVEILQNAIRVTFCLDASGGLHRGEWVLYDIT